MSIGDPFPSSWYMPHKGRELTCIPLLPSLSSQAISPFLGRLQNSATPSTTRSKGSGRTHLSQLGELSSVHPEWTRNWTKNSNKHIPGPVGVPCLEAYISVVWGSPAKTPRSRRVQVRVLDTTDHPTSTIWWRQFWRPRDRRDGAPVPT